MSEDVRLMILKPLTVLGHRVTSDDLVKVVVALANVPARFIAMDLMGPLPDHGPHWKQEVMNRLLQRWRNLGLIAFKAGRWSMTPKSWDLLQAAERERHP